MSSRHAPKLSIIIPALNEARCIGATLAAVSRLAFPIEVIVVDGGSEDNTAELAGTFGAKIIVSESGRGRQMHTGACAAQGDVLWFLHADTIVPVDSAGLILNALTEGAVVGGNFDVRFDGPGTAARFMTWLYPQLRRLGLCYGDSAFFVRRAVYDQIGGFKALPIFEDLDLLGELRKRGRFVHLPAIVVTSSRRFNGRSFLVTFVRWIALQTLYWLGTSPQQLARLYAPVREGSN